MMNKNTEFTKRIEIFQNKVMFDTFDVCEIRG